MSEGNEPIVGLVSVRAVFRTQAAEPSYWANTFEFRADSAFPGLTVGPEAYDALGQAISDPLRSLILEDYVLDRVVVSSIAVDGEPYAPNTFAVVDVQGVGVADTQSTPLPLTTVIRVAREVIAGRSGRLLLRGRLQASDLETGPAGARLAAPVIVSVEGTLAAVRAAAGTAGWIPVMARQPGVITALSRDITQFRVQGLGSKQLRSPRKLAPQNAIQRVAGALSDAGLAVEAINSVLTAFNALPLADVPLLP